MVLLGLVSAVGGGAVQLAAEGEPLFQINLFQVVIAATNFDHKIRAFDKTTGELLWETTLPNAGNATPATYQVNGRQFVVIAAGGGKANKPTTVPRSSVSKYVAYALPQ